MKKIMDKHSICKCQEEIEKELGYKVKIINKKE